MFALPIRLKHYTIIALDRDDAIAFIATGVKVNGGRMIKVVHPDSAICL